MDSSNPFAALETVPEETNDIKISKHKKRKDSSTAEDAAEEDAKQNVVDSKRRKIGEHASPAKVGTKPEAKDPETSQTNQDSKKKKKKPHKKKLKKATAQASGDSYAQVFGASAQPGIILNNEPRFMELKMKDVQNLMLWITTSDVPSPSWVLVKNKSLIKRLVVVAINSLQLDYFEIAEKAGLVPTLSSSVFAQRRLLKAPGSRDRMYDGVNALMRHQMSLRQLEMKKKLSQLTASPESVAAALEAIGGGNQQNSSSIETVAEKADEKAENETTDEVVPGEFDNWNSINTSPENLQQFLLTRSEMQSNLYPMDDTEGYARVAPDAPESIYDVLALDCEMCTTAAGLELTKITVLDKSLRVLYDSFVKPDRPIVDYNTRYSGITAEMLADVTTRVEDVQEKLLRGGIIGPNTVLVGHSLENDLHALRTYHARVADTAILFPHTQQEGHKNSLRFLAQRFLKEEIQQGSHDSEVDARTAMKLFLLKVKHGVHFGVSSMGDKQENILEVLSRKHLRSAVVDKSEICRQLAARDSDCFAVFDDDDATSQTVKLLNQPNHQFIFTHFHAIEKDNQHEESLNLLKEQIATSTHPAPVSEISQKQKDIFRRIDRNIETIWKALPRHCALMVVGSHGNMAHVRAVIDRKQLAFRDAKLEWKPEDEAGLEATIDWCRRTMAFFAVKVDENPEKK